MEYERRRIPDTTLIMDTNKNIYEIDGSIKKPDASNRVYINGKRVSVNTVFK